jgi:hypothetical protein
MVEKHELTIVLLLSYISPKLVQLMELSWILFDASWFANTSVLGISDIQE